MALPLYPLRLTLSHPLLVVLYLTTALQLYTTGSTLD